MALIDKIRRKTKGIVEEKDAEEKETEGNIVKAEEEQNADVYEEDIYSEELYEDNIYNDEIKEDTPDLSEDNIYEETEEEVRITNKEVKATLSNISKSGHSIVVTGCSGAGVSTVAFNIANTLSKLGYNTLLVDFDTETRAQSYLSVECYNAIVKEDISLERVINDDESIGANAALVKKNLYLLGLGVAVDAQKFSDTLRTEKIAKFIGVSKATFDFVVYDVPLNNIIYGCSDIALLCDTLINVTDSNTWGIMKTINSLLNIEDEHLVDVMFTKTKMLFNRVREDNRLMGKQFNVKKRWARDIDGIVYQLTEEDIGVYFTNMGTAGVLKYDKEIDNCWYSKKSYTDTKEGAEEFIGIIKQTFC